MGLQIASYSSGSNRGDTGDFYSVSRYIPLFDFIYMKSLKTEFDLVSLVFQNPKFYTGSYNNTSPKILSYLNDATNLRQVETNGLTIYIGKGVIYDSDKNILLTLSVETQYVIDLLNKKEYSWIDFFEYSLDFVGYDPFVMFVSTEFANDKKFAVLYRRIKKIYLDFCFEKGIEIRLVSSSKIKENTFTNSLNIKFNSLTELNRHLTEDVKHLIITPIEYFKNEQFPLLLNSPPTVVSEINKKVQIKDFSDIVSIGIKPHEAIQSFPNPSRDSMLEDSDADERDFEQQIVQINLENLPSQTLSEMMDRLNSQPVTWEEPSTSDRSTAAAIALMALTRPQTPYGHITREHLDDVINQVFDNGIRGTTTDLLYIEEDFPEASIEDVEDDGAVPNSPFYIDEYGATILNLEEGEEGQEDLPY